RIVQGVPGVERVIDHLTPTSTGITRVQAGAPAGEAPAPMPAPAPPIPEGGAAPAEPYPIGAPPGAPAAPGPPNTPPSAPPPDRPARSGGSRPASPYTPWPFIAPCTRSPRVPLGWRKVKLEWQDGYWWFSKVGCPYDWWRIRYW